MSREFGEYGGGGYFHNKIADAADDAKGGRDQLTRLWGDFLEEFSNVAYSISTSEACDSGEYDPIMENIARMPQLNAILIKIGNYLEPYEEVARRAVEKATEERKKK